jgi:hypothetical protein
MKPMLMTILLALCACTRVDDGLATRTIQEPLHAALAPAEGARLPELPPLSPDADTREIVDYTGD